MSRVAAQSGFSAVELLITLFIAAAFIATGYQLYSVILKSGGEANFRSRANNIAYDNLRRYSTQVTSPCTTVTPTPTPTIPSNAGISNAAVSVTITCPYGSASPTSKVRVSVTYGSPQQEVVHALLVTE